METFLIVLGILYSLAVSVVLIFILCKDKLSKQNNTKDEKIEKATKIRNSAKDQLEFVEKTIVSIFPNIDIETFIYKLTNKYYPGLRKIDIDYDGLLIYYRFCQEYPLHRKLYEDYSKDFICYDPQNRLLNKQSIINFNWLCGMEKVADIFHWPASERIVKIYENKYISPNGVVKLSNGNLVKQYVLNKIYQSNYSEYNQPEIKKEVVKTEAKQEPEKIETTKPKRKSNMTFKELDIPVGSKLVFIKNPNIIVTTVDEKNKVSYDGKTYALSKLACDLQHKDTAQGGHYFEYNGVLLTELRKQKEEMNK